MPILVKDVKWTQTENEVEIILKFNKNTTQPVDIFTSKKYLKVHSPPFLWESFLLYEIQNEESRCQVFPSLLKFSLKKSEKIYWDSLEVKLDQQEKINVRKEANKLKQESIEMKQKEMFNYKEQKKRGEIMNLTSRDAKTREDYQKAIRGAVQQELFGNRMNANEINNKNPSVLKKMEEKDVVKVQLKENHPVRKVALPDVRKSNSIVVSFSDRKFVTPKRESLEHEEQEWLVKQREARKAVGFVEEDLSQEERNPHWLKEKGDDFYKQENYLGAISAYSTAIRITDQYWELFMNRAAAHFSVGNFQKCVSMVLLHGQK